MNAPIEHIYADRQALTLGMVDAIEATLLAAIASRGAACIALSGGTTPIEVYKALSQRDLPWSQVQLTLTDERWVEVSDPASNEAMIRATLLQGPAAQARLTGFKTPAATPELAEAQVDAALATLAQPFDLVLLGMGEDAHTASLFPGGAGLDAAMDLAGRLRVRAVQPAGGGVARLSLTLPCLVSARRIALLITGDAKWAVYKKACEPGPLLVAPVRGVLHQTPRPTEVFWAA
jgi:6-phosphogluconolactonase